MIEDLKVMSYQLDVFQRLIDVRLERVPQENGIDKWAIRETGCCLAKDGEWEIEPMPSNRDDAFLERCRWDTAIDAYAFWLDGHESRYEPTRKRYLEVNHDRE